MIRLFKRLLNFFNIHPDKNQRWTLSTVFVVGLLYTYVQPAITKAWVSELPAEWIAFQSLAYSICGLLIGMIWKGWVRRKAIQWFTILCIIESAAGFFVGCGVQCVGVGYRLPVVRYAYFGVCRQVSDDLPSEVVERA